MRKIAWAGNDVHQETITVSVYVFALKAQRVDLIQPGASPWGQGIKEVKEI